MINGRTIKLRLIVTYGLLQRKVMARWYSGIMHISIFSGFLVLFIGSLLIQVDSYILKPFGLLISWGNFYQAFQAALDTFGLIFIIGLALALYRRIWKKPEYVEPSRQILVILLVLFYVGVTGFALEGLRMNLESKPYDAWAFVGRTVSSLIKIITLSDKSKLLLYKFLWWSHALVAFALIAAIPYTQLIHMFTSLLNIMFSSPRPKCELQTPFNLMELIETGNFDVKVGAKTIEDFDWSQQLGLMTCTNCGRCQEMCPAYATGTALSPRRMIQNLKNEFEMEGYGNNKKRKLLEHVVSEDEVWACTLCGACIEACPVLIHPPNYIVQLRRELVSRSRLDKKKTDMLSNLSYALNPYGLPHSDREDLARELGVQTLSENPNVEYLYWIGCVATYDARSREISKTMVKIMKKAGVSFGILGAEERCTGDPARRVGEEGKFQELAFQNIETLNRYHVKKIITHCAHCFNTLKNEYPEFGGQFEVIHHSLFIHELIQRGQIQMVKEITDRVTLHDSCYIGRFNRVFDVPRYILSSVPSLKMVEMERNKENSFCCGAGGTNYWYEVPRTEKVSTLRIKEAKKIEACVLAVECPYCLRMFEDALKITGLEDEMKIKDIAEIVAKALAE